MKHRVFWTCVLPEELIAKHKLSFAACNFSFNLMSGGYFDMVYSALPVYVGGEMEPNAFQDPRFELIYDKLRRKGGVWQKIAAIKEQWTIYKHIPDDSSIWFYNINALNALLFLLLRISKPSVQLNVIVLDYTPVERGISLQKVYLKLINSANGRICLANSPVFNGKNTIIIPGVVPMDEIQLPSINHPLPRFLLSGALNNIISQTTMVLEAFSRLPGCELHICGSQNIEVITAYANKYANIIYHGQLNSADYYDLLHSVTFQLSTRNSSYPENKCNFPSKIIEALLHNRSVISTIHYPQLDGINYFVVSSDVDEFVLEIQRIVSLSELELQRYINQGSVAKERFSPRVWEIAMNKIEAA